VVKELVVTITWPNGETSEIWERSDDPHRSKTYAGLFSQSTQSGIDHGTLFLRRADGGTVFLEDYLPEEGEVHLILEKILLPSFWDGQEKYRPVRKMIFLVVPGGIDKYTEIVSVMSDAGWRASYTRNIEGTQVWMQKHLNDSNQFFQNGVVLIHAAASDITPLLNWCKANGIPTYDIILGETEVDPKELVQNLLGGLLKDVESATAAEK